MDECTIMFKCVRIMLPNNIMNLDICFKKLNLVKVGSFAWYSIEIRVIFGVRFERWKVDKANLHENWKMQTQITDFWIFLPNVVKLILTISSYTVSKLVHFWDTV